MPKIDRSELAKIQTSVQSERIEILQNFQQYSQDIEKFTNETALESSAWNSAKNYVAPYKDVAKGMYNLLADFGETLGNYMSSFEAEVGSPDNQLDTDHLQDLQNRLSRLQQQKTDLMARISGFLPAEIIGGYGVMFKELQIDQTQKKVDILEKYAQFEASHGGDFAQLVLVSANLKSALSALGKSGNFNQKTGQYIAVDYSKSDWYNKVTKYNKNAPEERMEVVPELIGMSAGQAQYRYLVYIDGKYSAKATANYEWVRMQKGLKQGAMIAGEVTPYSDLYRLIWGTDPWTGNKINRAESAAYLSLWLLPEAKFIECVTQIKAGNHLLNGVQLTEKELKALTSAGYFEEVAKVKKISLDDIIKNGDKTSNHSISANNRFSIQGKPNSSVDILNPDGSVKQRRYFDDLGRAVEDIDFNHADDGTHVFPHRHKWDWTNPDKPKRLK